MSDAPEAIPRNILTTLFRGLVWGAWGDQITPEEQAAAWEWLEERNPYEEMGT